MLALPLKKIIFLGCSLFFLAFSSSASQAQPINQIVAIVNDQVITNLQLQTAMASFKADQIAAGKTPSDAEVRKQALNQLIDKDLQLQVAKLAKITVSDDQLNAALADIAKQHQLTIAQLPSALAQQGLNFDQFKNQIKEQLIIQNFQQQQLAGTINITPKEIDTLAKKLATQPPPQQTLYHFIDILIPLPQKPTEQDLLNAKQKFDAIANAINQKKDFDGISQSILGAPAHDLGWRSVDQLPPGFVSTASKMSIGNITPPMRTPEGIHILKLVDEKMISQATDLNNDITETHVRHILLKKDALTPDLALERRLLSLRDQIVHGADFAKIAEENSQDPGSVSNGGDLGWVKPETLDPKFEAAMNKLKVSEISQPVQSQYGWHLIQVLGRKQAEDQQTALKLKAQQILFQQKMQEALKQLLSQLRAQAYVKIIEAK